MPGSFSGLIEPRDLLSRSFRENMSPAPSSSTSTTNPTSAAKQVFDPFRKLPPEIRLMIWKSALPGPRVVDLCTNGEVRRGEYGYDHLITHCPPPGMLQACSESRAVAKKDYTVFFNHHINMKPQYFNFEIDTLYIPNIPLAFIALLEPILKGFEDEEDSILTRLRHLMVAGQIGETWGRVGYIMLDEFSNLDTLVLEQPLPDSFDPEDVNAEELSLEATSKLEHNVRLGVWCGKDLETDSYPSISFLPGQAMDDRAIAMRYGA